MAAHQDDEELEKPLDPAVEKVRRKLLRFVVINLGILFLALMAVVVALVYRATRVGNEAPATISELPLPAAGELLEGTIDLPPGARIIAHGFSGGVVSLHVELADKSQTIWLYDLSSGRMIGQFAIRAAQ